MRLSERAQAVKPSATLATAAKARSLKAQGIDVVTFATGELLPNRTIWLDLDPAKGVRRSLDRQTQSGEACEDRFESEKRDFHERIRKGYSSLCTDQPMRVRRVEGSGTVEEVSERIWTAMSDLFEG